MNKKYQSVKITLEKFSHTGCGPASYILELEEGPEPTEFKIGDKYTGPKGRAEYKDGGNTFLVNVEGFARGFLEFIVDDLEKQGFFNDNKQWGSAFPGAFDYNPSKRIGIHVVDQNGTSREKEVTGDTNPYQDRLYEMLMEPFKRCLGRSPLGDFSGKQLPHYEAFHRR